MPPASFRSPAGALACALLASACADAPTRSVAPDDSAPLLSTASGAYTVTLEAVRELTPRAGLVEFTQFAGQRGVPVFNTGLGSAMAPAGNGEFWFLTDRGPNVDYPSPPDGKLFPAPDFAPRLVLFGNQGGRLVQRRSIDLRNAAGTPLTGMPLPIGTCGSTAERGYYLDNGTIRERYDLQGIDSEGLAIAPNGDFWISDEYGPFIARYDAMGREQARYGPCAGPATTPALPAVLATRRANRGMEGLTRTPGGLIVGMMQSPLDNPRTAGRASRALRIVVLDPADPRPESTRQFVYLAETPALLASEIVAIDEENFLVLERDGNFPGSTPGAVKRIYKASLRGPSPSDPVATDESDPANAPTGKSYGGFGATLESVADFAGAGIVPLYKTLVVDLVADLPGYPHDKPEGIALVGRDRIFISNDDDFGVADNLGTLVSKRLPGSNRIDYNTLWAVKVSPPLR
jgi:hypothetical protein